MKLKRILAALLVSVTGLSQAGVVVGGSTLLDGGGLSQLEAWLGKGELTLTNIFTKTFSTTSLDFHAAVDGKGPTFSLMYVTEGSGPFKTIGGYNPVSWNSSDTRNYSANPLDWNAFIFNLSDGVKRAQTEGTQTYNGPNYGPTFGAGQDITVFDDLRTGVSSLYSYEGVGTPSRGTSIIDGAPSRQFNLLIGWLEVFTIAEYVAPEPENNVPEPGTLALLGAGVLAMGLNRRRREPSAGL